MFVEMVGDESGGACACGMGICDVAEAVALQKG